MKDNAKNRYKKKCKVRTITFYPNDKDIYEVSKSINFQDFVKHELYLIYMSTDGKASNG